MHHSNSIWLVANIYKEFDLSVVTQDTEQSTAAIIYG